MAKKTAARRPKRRLKKTVRRSLAAVLMVTAIAVAAIPVPENLAVNPQADTDEVVSPVAYEERALGNPPNNPYVLPKPESAYVDANGDKDEAALKAAKDAVNETIRNALDPNHANYKSNLVPTEIVTEYEGGLYLTWQFLYEKTGDKTGRLVKYNDEFPAKKVNLGLKPNSEYFIVHENAYNLYFTHPEALNKKDDGPNGEPADTLKLSGMNNLTETDNFYPKTPIEFKLTDIDWRTGNNRLEADYIAFFEKYFAEDYKTTLSVFQEYWKAYKAAYEKATEDGELDPAQIAEASAGPKPTDLKRAPSDITDGDLRQEFFCEHNKTLSALPNYELEMATDRRLTGGKDRVYVAHGDGNVPANATYKDVDGYLVMEDATLINTIAYRAFADVHNVGQIEISTYVSTIERSAFEEANITSVNIGNARTIGDRAFYNCKSLTQVTFGTAEAPSPTDTIGVEAFRGSGINTKLELPRYIARIGHGAFAFCLDLSEVQFYETGVDCTISDFAFYGDTRLQEVNFARTVFTSIGKCAFAIAAPSGDAMTDFHFPSEGLQDMSDYVLANRQNLQKVYIENYAKKIPTHTFYNCFNLKEARFSNNCGAAYFDSELFKDVTTKEDETGIGFCVYGPETYNNSPAGPRTSTWNAVRTDGLGIPYVYEKDGKKHYEMALDSDGARYRYAASEDGTLISCALITKDAGLIDLIIPDKIGGIKIEKIGDGCFNDKDLREAIRSITIKNNSISEIGDSVFRDLKKLNKVWIGDSVTKIGANAFAGCDKLLNVYFAKPKAGYEALPYENIGNNAFMTTGEKLIFHGGIVEEYGPFKYAMDEKNLLKDPDSQVPDVNIAYQGLWDSDEGAHLTVLPDRVTGEVTLLDYPKLSDLENISRDVELQDYCHDMEDYYYYTVYNGGGSNNNVDTLCTEYAYIFDAYRKGEASAVLPDGSVVPATAIELEKRYGPWINPIYCEGAWKDYLSGQGTQDTAAGGQIADFLFKPLVAEAATDPTPYFEEHPYNFMDNYENYLKMDPADYNNLPDYKSLQPKEWRFIQATRDIYVPAAVKSIDVVAYKDKNENAANYDKYIKDTPANTMYTSSLGGAKPGLFSGYYQDYEGDDDSREKAVRGNDTITSVVLTAVTSIPDLAFDSCEQLSRVEMPAVKSVGKLPFRDCENLIHLVGSADYPAERGILYEKHQDADGNDRYRIVECLMARGKPQSGNDTLAVSTVSSANDSLLPLLCETCDTDITESGDKRISIPAIAEGAFDGCKYISIVDLSNSSGLKTIPQHAFKDNDRLGQVILPGSVNKIADEAFVRTAASGTTHANVTIYGREVDIADNAFTPGSDFTIYSYEDSAAKRYTDRHTDIEFKVLDAYRVWFYDYDGTPLGGAITVDKGTKIGDDIPEAAKVVMENNHRLGYTFVGWMSNDGKTTNDPITSDMTIFVAQYKNDGTLVGDKCSVQFIHGRTGKLLTGFGMDESGRYLVVPGTTFYDPLNSTSDGRTLELPAVSPNPTEDGYSFLGEYKTDEGEAWDPNTTPISRNMTVLALFGQNGGNTSGGSTSGGTTSKGTTSKSSTSKKSTSSSSTSSSSTSSSSTSSTSTTSAVSMHRVTVVGGSGSGIYSTGATVVIAANEPAAGTKFTQWTTNSPGVTLNQMTATATIFTMPENDVLVTANFEQGTAPVSPPGTPAVVPGTNNGQTQDNGSTRVDIEKPGISNRDLATANTNGSTDNFVVKISETDEATRAVAAALTNKYGTLDNILYYAMDISLYDSTGTTKITDTTGLSVDITIPIPDSLVAYGGNNMAGAVINGDQLENLNENFTTINGIPCVRFRATHFSPYTIYVDTGNLVAGELDVTPKTGDPIHPKWFLSLGLACLSVILFLKRDKKVAVKA